MHTVLPQKDTLPSAKAESAIGKGDDLRGTRECHLDVTGHIIWAFMGMDEFWVVIRNKVIHEDFKVTSG